jgi:hypothetical protein
MCSSLHPSLDETPSLTAPAELSTWPRHRRAHDCDDWPKYRFSTEPITCQAGGYPVIVPHFWQRKVNADEIAPHFAPRIR